MIKIYDSRSYAKISTEINLFIHLSDSIYSPNSSQEATQIRKKHNADLVIFGKGILNNCKEKLCFKYDFKGTENSFPLIKEQEFNNSFVDISIENMNSLSIDGHSFKEWVRLMIYSKAKKQEKVIKKMLDVGKDPSINKILRAKKYYLIASLYNNCHKCLNRSVSSESIEDFQIDLWNS